MFSLINTDNNILFNNCIIIFQFNNIHPASSKFSLYKPLLKLALKLQIVYLRNEFNFWNVHGIMNTFGL